MHKLKIGDDVQASLSGGRVVEAIVMAVINKTDALVSKFHLVMRQR